MTGDSGPQPAFGELVNGLPARVWDVTFRGDESHRGSTSASAFVSDRIALSDRVTLAAALRVDSDRGSATGAATAIHWFTATPRVTLRWRPADSVVITGGYAWYGHQLPLSYLAVGDPSGPAGVMSRWDDRNGDGRFSPSELTAVAAVGSCCTAAGPGVIDESLRRPVTSEFRIGFEHSIGAWRWGVTGLDRRERHLAALVNTGVTAADYVVTFIDDPGIDIAGLSGVEPLPIFDRTPASFLRDAYQLTNTDEEPSRYQGLELTLAREVGGWLFRFGGSAYLSEGVGADRGYHASENDQGLLGEVFTNPNATTHARGRLFYDRAFVMKVLGGYQSKGPLGAWFVARYQDGQPFARVVVADGLNQGPEAVQAYPRGGQRFTYTLTLDARVALQWSIGDRRKRRPVPRRVQPAGHAAGSRGGRRDRSSLPDRDGRAAATRRADRLPADVLRAILDLAAPGESGDVFAGAERERLDGHRRLAAAGGHQAAAVAQEEIRDVVAAMVLVDHRRRRIVAHAARAEEVHPRASAPSPAPS